MEIMSTQLSCCHWNDDKNKIDFVYFGIGFKWIKRVLSTVLKMDSIGDFFFLTSIIGIGY